MAFEASEFEARTRTSFWHGGNSHGSLTARLLPSRWGSSAADHRSPTTLARSRLLAHARLTGSSGFGKPTQRDESYRHWRIGDPDVLSRHPFQPPE